MRAGQLISHVLARPMKPNPECRRATTRRLGRPTGVKTLPRHEQQGLTLTRRQRGHGHRQTLAHLRWGLPPHTLARGQTLQPCDQRAPPAVRPHLIGQEPTRDPKQPRQRIVPERVQPPPRHQERLGYHILDRS